MAGERSLEIQGWGQVAHEEFHSPEKKLGTQEFFTADTCLGSVESPA